MNVISNINYWTLGMLAILSSALAYCFQNQLFLKIISRTLIRVSNGLDPHQAWTDSSDLGPNCFQRLPLARKELNSNSFPLLFSTQWCEKSKN